MEPLVRTRSDEAASLAMENELLRYETVHLRARLAEAEQALARAAGNGKQQLGPPAGSRPEADQARDDLVWLLRRLDGTPIGPLLRRRGGIRTLREKYLGETR